MFVKYPKFVNYINIQIRINSSYFLQFTQFNKIHITIKPLNTHRYRCITVTNVYILYQSRYFTYLIPYECKRN